METTNVGAFPETSASQQYRMETMQIQMDLMAATEKIIFDNARAAGIEMGIIPGDEVNQHRFNQQQPTDYTTSPTAQVENRIRCNTCRLAFPDENAHKQYIVKHLPKDKIHFCFQCTDAFCRSEDLVLHMRTHEWQKSYRCMQCNRHFSSQQNLQRHIASHSKQKPFKCAICGKDYASSRTLNVHLECHSQEKNQHCPICEKTFVHENQLNRHVKTHTQERPYKCTFCVNKTYVKPGSLKTHMKLHQQESPFKCIPCKVYFKQKTDWKTHMNSHDFSGVDRNSYSTCPVCDRYFMNKTFLSIHMQKTHNIFKCLDCGKNFNSENDWRSHTFVCNKNPSFFHPPGDCHIGEIFHTPGNETEVSSTNQMFGEEQQVGNSATERNNIPLGVQEELCECHLCNIPFTAQVYLDSHLRRHHNGEIGLPQNKTANLNDFGDNSISPPHLLSYDQNLVL